MTRVVDEARETFRSRYRREPRVAIAPGRVNLIGEHTDYNDGFVFPAAIDRYCAFAFDANDEGLLRGWSSIEGEERVASVRELTPPSERSWFDYAAGVLWAHREGALPVEGMDFVVGGDVPLGAGLSSSAAFELAVARAVVDLTGGLWDGAREAGIARKAENEFVGVPCGIMDQMAASISREGSAMLLDCRSLDAEWVRLPESVLIAVLDTGTRRTLVGSEYGERRRSCEEAASALSVRALRDATVQALERKRGDIDETTYRRALHVITENARARDLALALSAFDRENIRRLMKASHESMRDLFEISSPALDRIVEIAWRHPAALGARMTGGGFAGAAVALIEEGGAEGFSRDVEAFYRRETGLPGRVLLCRAVGGARIVP